MKSGLPVLIAAMAFLPVLVISVGHTAQGWHVNNKEHGRYNRRQIIFLLFNATNTSESGPNTTTTATAEDSSLISRTRYVRTSLPW